jgi:hypothetical protein
MESVAVTITSSYMRETNKENITRDLLLPLDTPQYILVSALVDALKIDLDKENLRGYFSTLINEKKEPLPLEKTLRSIGIKYGDYLVLDFQVVSAQASLICEDGPEFDLERDEVTVGCDPDADIDLRSVPKQEIVSRYHAKIIYRDSNYYIMDMGSTNGTYIGGKLIPPSKEFIVKNEEIILLGASDEKGVKLFIKRRS